MIDANGWGKCFFRKGWPAAVLLCVMAAGCVEREIYLQSEPPNATVCLDGRDYANTPVAIPFEYYGTHFLALRAPGYEAKWTHVEVSPPWYQYFPLDLFTELLWPWTIKDRQTYTFELTPFIEEDQEGEHAILERANEVRYGTFSEYGEEEEQ
jgi:hypothetical protein